ncbi:MAG TPA: DUF72 domain-containing protein [Pyrinomonadaceae bacterium]|jgi:uncharacterized protein YecE (DUF72 family)
MTEETTRGRGDAETQGENQNRRVAASPRPRVSAFVGCQGWNYDDWVTGPGGRVFYPRGTRAAGMLEVYARAFETVEVDSTFYAIPPLSTFESWAKRTPPRFTFSLKLPQEITHERGLGSGSAELLAEFADRARSLGPKLACVLIQLPPQFELTPETGRSLRKFLPRLPRDLRFSIEFRSASWLRQSVLDFLAEHSVSPALVEGQWLAPEDNWQLAEQLAGDFVYVRWMGARNLTRFDAVQRPQDDNLSAWAKTISRLNERAPSVYAYFSNFYEGHAPESANKLKRLLGQTVVEAADLEDQPSLF